MITYAITACNEREELTRLLGYLYKVLPEKSEIIVQTDENNTSAEVRELLSDYSYHKMITAWVQYPLNNDFAAYKNNLFKHAKGDWIFQIDADEVPNHELIEALPSILSGEDVPDVIVVPRINTVHGITADHIKEWNWRISVIEEDALMVYEPIKGMSSEYVELLINNGAIISKNDDLVCYHELVINFPDYQWRLYRNKPEIRWVNKVHEKLSGHDSYGILPAEFSWCLMHRKNIQRQERQNLFYSSIMHGE